MTYEFYKGATLSVLFSTPIPAEGARQIITGFNPTVKIGGYICDILAIDEYSFRATLAASKTLKLEVGNADIVLYLEKLGKVSVGKVTGLIVVEPATDTANIDDTSDVVLTVTELELQFDMTLNNLLTYQDLTPEEIAELMSGVNATADALFAELGLSITACNTATQGANEATNLANEATVLATDAVTLATQAAALANEKAGDANDAAILANSKAGEANAQALYANEQGDYALEQGDYAKAQGELAQTAREGIEDEITQLDSDVGLFKEESNLKDAIQDSKIKDIENVLSTANLNQSAQLSVSGVSPLSLPKNAANGGMSVKLEGLTEDVGGVITHFEPTGRVRSVDKNGLNPTALYLTAPELRSNGTVKDEIRKSGNGHELVKRVGVGTLGSELITNGGFNTDTTGWIKSINAQLSVVDGKLKVENLNAAGYNWAAQAFPTVAGKYYQFKFKYTKEAASAIGAASMKRNSTSGTNIYLSPLLSTSTQYSILFKAESAVSVVMFYVFIGTIGTYALYDDISVELVDTEDLPATNSSTTDLSTVATFTLATPVITPISYGGILNSAENGTVYHEPIIADAGVYDTKMDILLTDYPIATIEEIIKHENGIDTYLNVTTAVIASDGLSFTHPDLADGDLVLFTYAFDKESTNGNITATFYDSNVVKIDTVTGKAYRINEVVTNGVLTRTLTEV